MTGIVSAFVSYGKHQIVSYGKHRTLALPLPDSFRSAVIQCATTKSVKEVLLGWMAAVKSKIKR